MITIPREICIDLDQALNKEWLVGNGIGGYASGTIVGLNTRRYHGLLVASLHPPVERTVLLANIDAQVEVGDRTFYLGCNEYPDKIHPGGFVYIEEFRLEDGIPTTVYGLSDRMLHKTVWMEHGHNTSYVRYTYAEGEGEISLVLDPLCSYRDYHAMARGDFNRGLGVEPVPGGCKVTAREGAQPYWLTTSPMAEFTPTGVWYWNFIYRREVERGFDEQEDLYMPGLFRAMLQPGESITLIASTEPPETRGSLAGGAYEREVERQQALLAAAGVAPRTQAQDENVVAARGEDIEEFKAQLVRAGDTFMVMRDVEVEGAKRAVPTVLAGYHWFVDWGRDTMISLPGLTLPTGRRMEAEQILRTFALFLSEGMLPNNFPDVGAKPDYNTVDATLWMFHALEAALDAGGDKALLRELYPKLEEVINWHIRGTRYGIHMDPNDALLSAGEEGVQLTWMDAKVDNWVVTPRTGKQVEINALWYNALRVMEKLRASLRRKQGTGEDGSPNYKVLAEWVKESFAARFWYEEGGYLFDVVDGPGGGDASLRPNQLVALARPGLIDRERAQRALGVVRERLLTPYGLRTLSPDHPEYKPRYEGNRWARDGAYHNGTVWPWLLGPYFDAVRVVEGDEAARSELERMLPALRAHLEDAGLGTISEIFDADPPHDPKGCIAQAWSVAEVLRLVSRL
jgi:predicted glycogen debranching enzyme